MSDELSWDLGSITTFNAGNVLETTVTVVAPESGTYYLVGALYDTSLNYISNSLFGVLQSEVGGTAVNSPTHVSLFDLSEDEELSLDCMFTLNRTSCILALFLYKLGDSEPDLSVDEQIASVSTSLQGETAFDWSTFMNGVMALVMMGVVVGIIWKEV